MTEPVGKPHPQQTEEVWLNVSLAEAGKEAMRVAFNAIPTGDTVRAEWFCELLMQAVRGGLSLEDARDKLGEVWK